MEMSQVIISVVCLLVKFWECVATKCVKNESFKLQLLLKEKAINKFVNSKNFKDASINARKCLFQYAQDFDKADMARIVTNMLNYKKRMGVSINQIFGAEGMQVILVEFYSETNGRFREEWKLLWDGLESAGGNPSYYSDLRLKLIKDGIIPAPKN